MKPMNQHFAYRKLTPLAALIGLAAVLAGCTSTPSGAAVTVQEQEWVSPGGLEGVRLLTEHFDLRLTARDPVLREYLPGFMEGAFAEYRRIMPPAQPSPDPLVIYLFDTRQEWAAFTRHFAPVQAHTYLHIQSGGYTDFATATAVAFDLRRDRTLSLLAHEGMHQYLARYFPEPVPPWLNEGLACQWEAFELRGHRPVFTPRRNHLRRNNLREALSGGGGLIPLPELLRMNAGDAVIQTGQPTRVYYAQVWSLVLFLREGAGGRYNPQFNALLADAGTPRLRHAINAYRAAMPGSESWSDGEVAFRQYITNDLDTFTTEYADFARRLLN
jgi:hypothetical protein